jgi:hypothetical protein
MAPSASPARDRHRVLNRSCIWHAAADSDDVETDLRHGASRFDRAADEFQHTSAPPQAPPANPVGAASVAALGQRRVDSVGFPIAATAMWCIGATRAICHATAARLSTHAQRADEDAVGEFAHEGEMGRADRGHNRRRQHGKSRAAVRCASHHGVSLETPLSRGSVQG